LNAGIHATRRSTRVARFDPTTPIV
jgi:hypothetical protein